jgi:hypothetical protein
MHPDWVPEDEDYGNGAEEGSSDKVAPRVANVITMEDLMMVEDEKADDEDAMENEEEQEMFRQQFLAELRRRERLEKSKNAVVMGMEDEEEDKFLMGLEETNGEEESYLDIKKR